MKSSSEFLGLVKVGGCSLTSRIVMVINPLLCCWTGGSADVSVTNVVNVTTAATPLSRASFTKISPVSVLIPKKFCLNEKYLL